MSCFTERSRSGVPICPRKYLETTMLVACCDQNFGNSTSRCSKTSSPRSLAMTAERSSQSISSNGSTPSFVKYRSNSRPATSRPGPKVRPIVSVEVVSLCCACCMSFAHLSYTPTRPPLDGQRRDRMINLRRRPGSAPERRRLLAKCREGFRSRLFVCRGTNMRLRYLVVKTEPLHIVARNLAGRQILTIRAVRLEVLSLALFLDQPKSAACFCTALHTATAQCLMPSACS